MRRVGVFLLLWLLVVTATGRAGQLDRVLFMSEEYPPFNFEQDGRPQGLSIELLAEVFRITGSGRSVDEVQILPWARSYRAVQEQADTCLFVMTRTREREALFKWAGPVAPTRIVLLAKKGAGVIVRSPHDLRKYRIGVVRDDVGQQLLEKAGYPQARMEMVSSSAHNAEKLARGRIDAWAYEESVARYVLGSIGQDPAQYESVYTFQTGAVYFAFNRRTDDAAVAEMQAALDRLRSQGVIRGILARYGVMGGEREPKGQKGGSAPR